MSKKVANFAATSKLKGGLIRLYAAGIFYVCTLQISGVTPAGNCNGTPALEVLVNRVSNADFLLLQQTNFSEMTSTETNCLRWKIAPKSDTSAHETGIKSFSFEGTQEVRVVIINSIPYFVAIDIAKALGYYVPKDAVTQHCRKAVKHRLSDNNGVPHDYNVIPESDVYRLIIRSNLPTAEKFQEWVFEEVLPTIRQNGFYATPQAAKNLTGQLLQVTGADGNLYLLSILKAMRELIIEDTQGNVFNELRFVQKFEAANTLFPEHKRELRNGGVEVC